MMRFQFFYGESTNNSEDTRGSGGCSFRVYNTRLQNQGPIKPKHEAIC